LINNPHFAPAPIAIDRNLLARPHDHGVADLHFGHRQFRFLSVTLNAGGFAVS
jgi:hypothetical protein